MNVEGAERNKTETNEDPKQEALVTSHAEITEMAANTDEADNKEPGRNDPCPCGAINPATGEVYKWKKCGMIDAPQHRKSLIN